jgi:tetratricopeptide (TPR) repeat protein
MAAVVRDLEVVRFLLDKGADVDGRGTNNLPGWTAMKYAVSEGGKSAVVKLLLERGADVEARDDHEWSALMIAAYRNRADLAKILMARGADIDHAVSKVDSEVAKDSRYRENGLAAARRLREWREKFKQCAVRYRPDDAMAAAFAEAAAKYRSAPVNPELPEEARVFRVQAEHAVSQKRFQDAVDLYGKALKVSPWWPEGHFNQALILGESDCPEEAIAAMERYLALVPDAPDARAARDRIYQWKGWIP